MVENNGGRREVLEVGKIWQESRGKYERNKGRAEPLCDLMTSESYALVNQ